MKEEVLPTPVPFGFRLSIAQEGSESKAGAGKRRKKKVLRLEKAYIDFLTENSLPPPYQPLPSFDRRFNELQESHAAKQTADIEECDNILKQYAEYGCAYVEIEFTDDEKDEGFAG
ncbi:hypothetical protein PVAP13_6NG266400 [Panicum virgatum]|uniref:Uncharacterized protein n=1 Tax=Panicum virgatum TaxID=38727 RepID=A0A8T0R3T8_PANVG|nr:hypothetical protein PVAP13_6NG266400 [Panicum virgatum]